MNKNHSVESVVSSPSRPVCEVVGQCSCSVRLLDSGRLRSSVQGHGSRSGARRQVRCTLTNRAGSVSTLNTTSSHRSQRAMAIALAEQWVALGDLRVQFRLQHGSLLHRHQGPRRRQGLGLPVEQGSRSTGRARRRSSCLRFPLPAAPDGGRTRSGAARHRPNRCRGPCWRSTHADQRTVQAAKTVLGGCDQPAWGGGIGVIGDDPGGGVSRSAVLREAGRGRSGRRLVGSAEHDAGPVGDQCLGRSEPKAAAAAGHQVDPVAQSQIHAAILPRRAGRARRRKPAVARYLALPGKAANRNGWRHVEPSWWANEH